MPYSPFDRGRESTVKQNNQGFLFGLLLIGLLFFFIANNNGLIDFDQSPSPVVIENDKVEPDKKETNGVPLEECLLLVIRDKGETNQDIGYSETMVDDDFWLEVNEKLADVEIVSPNDDVAAEFLARNKLSAPIVCLVNTKSKQVLWQIPLPKGGTDPIREKLFE